MNKHMYKHRNKHTNNRYIMQYNHKPIVQTLEKLNVGRSTKFPITQRESVLTTRNRLSTKEMFFTVKTDKKNGVVIVKKIK